MNKKGGVFTGVFIIIVIILVLGIAAIMSEGFKPVIQDGLEYSGTEGIEALILENIYLVVFLFGGLAIMLIKYLDFSGGED